MEEPLLFIPSPPVYFLEIKESEQTFLDESTSVFEPLRSDRILDQVIARQLNYFSQPINQNRLLLFKLVNGETVIGVIEGLEGINVKIKNGEQILIINGNEIETINLSKNF